MNPIATAAIGSILRWALAIGAGYLVKAGIWTGSDAETYVTAATLGALGLGWSLWQNNRGRLKLLTALHWAGVSEQEVRTHIAAGAPTPPVSTPTNEVPTPVA